MATPAARERDLRATEIDWNTIRHFRPEEWPTGSDGRLVLAHMRAALIERLDGWRAHILGPVVPSPDPEGHVRASGRSRHSLVGPDGPRLSDATDVFVPRGWWGAWVQAQRAGFGGIGLYFDTRLRGEPAVMMHLDLRPMRLLWARVDGVYVYPHRGRESRLRFLQALQEATQRFA